MDKSVYLLIFYGLMVSASLFFNKAGKIHDSLRVSHKQYLNDITKIQSIRIHCFIGLLLICICAGLYGMNSFNVFSIFDDGRENNLFRAETIITFFIGAYYIIRGALLELKFKKYSEAFASNMSGYFLFLALVVLS